MFEPPKTFIEPQKLILKDRRLFSQFRYTKAYFYISNFIEQTNTLVKGKQYSDAPEPSEGI